MTCSRASSVSGISKAIVACALDRDTARLMGINVDRMVALTFLIGSALSGAAGIMIVPADMPSLDRALIAGLVAAFRANNGEKIVLPVTASGGQRNPVIWPVRLRGDLDEAALLRALDRGQHQQRLAGAEDAQRSAA